MAREPVDLLVVGQHIVLMLGRANEPALARVLNQRIVVRSPAERILVLVLVQQVEFAFFFQAACDGLVAIFDPLAFVVGSFRGELAVGSNRTDQFGAFA